MAAIARYTLRKERQEFDEREIGREEKEALLLRGQFGNTKAKKVG